MDARTVGAWVQGLILGIALFFALAQLFGSSGTSEVAFRYQGF